MTRCFGACIFVLREALAIQFDLLVEMLHRSEFAFMAMTGCSAGTFVLKGAYDILHGILTDAVKTIIMICFRDHA